MRAVLVLVLEIGLESEAVTQELNQHVSAGLVQGRATGRVRTCRHTLHMSPNPLISINTRFVTNSDSSRPPIPVVCAVVSFFLWGSACPPFRERAPHHLADSEPPLTGCSLVTLCGFYCLSVRGCHNDLPHGGAETMGTSFLSALEEGRPGPGAGSLGFC